MTGASPYNAIAIPTMTSPNSYNMRQERIGLGNIPIFHSTLGICIAVLGVADRTLRRWMEGAHSAPADAINRLTALARELAADAWPGP